MHNNYGILLRSVFAHYFNSIRITPQSIEDIRNLSKRGTIVFVARSANLLHFLYLNHICNQYDLPLARFVNGVDTILFQPLGLLIQRLHTLGNNQDEDFDEEGDDLPGRQLTDALQSGAASLLFLDRPATLTNPKECSRGFEHDPNQTVDHNHLLKTLVTFGRKTSKPVYLIPHLTIWGLHPEKESQALADTIFGLPESPGLLRNVAQIIRHHRNAFVKVAQPIELNDFLEKNPQGDLSCVANALQQELAHRLEMEVFDVTGPKIKPAADFKREVLQDEMIQGFIRQSSNGDSAGQETLQKNAHDLLDEIAAEPRIRWPLTFSWILKRMWNRMYDGIQVEGYEKIRTAVRKSSVVLCPSHKSHIDYLILSQLCLMHAVPLPHIAAGINLSFWPLGPIFRHSGAFFLRRSFKGSHLYPVVFRTYLRHVMKDGYPIEFFIEGTRSRTGKLLNPRYGILSWLIQAHLEGTGEDLQFVPISIDYEKIVESRSYVKELTGGEKKKENVTGLLKSSKVIRSKYGKIYVQVGDPISFKEFLEERNFQDAHDEELRRDIVQEMAFKILFGINQVSTVTPSALAAFALLSHRKRGMSQKTFLGRASWSAEWIKNRGHERFSPILKQFKRCMAEATMRFSHDGLVSIHDTGHELVFSPIEHKRLALDYYRNNIIHHFIPAAICVSAFASLSSESATFEQMLSRIRDLSVLFKYEFLFRSEDQLEEEVNRSLRELSNEKVFKLENNIITKNPEGRDHFSLFLTLLEHFIEAYWLCAYGLRELRKGALSEKELISRMLHTGDQLYARGDIILYESLNREAVKNALMTFENRGVLIKTHQEGRKGSLISLNPSWNQPNRLASLTDELAKYRHVQPT